MKIKVTILAFMMLIMLALIMLAASMTNAQGVSKATRTVCVGIGDGTCTPLVTATPVPRATVTTICLGHGTCTPLIRTPTPHVTKHANFWWGRDEY